MINPRRYLLDVDTKDMPGRVKLVFATFETKIMSVEKFAKGTYKLLDQGSPEAALLCELLAGGSE